MNNVDLPPGWLARDMARAQTRVEEWQAVTARFNGGHPHDKYLRLAAWIISRHEAALAAELAERAEMLGLEP